MVARLLAVLAALLSGGDAAAERPAGCEPLVVAASWSAGTLTVEPSRCGRRIAVTAPQRVLDAALATAGDPAGGDRTLVDQLRCHAYFASFKHNWNLEAARPVVSWPKLIATACNPPVPGS
jgi:uncharacterized protein DUF2599